MELLDYGARRYDPQIGRFLSPDTIIPDPSNPQSFNRYSYVSNNPLRYTDPTGHIQCGEVSECTPSDYQRYRNTIPSFEEQKQIEENINTTLIVGTVVWGGIVAAPVVAEAVPLVSAQTATTVGTTGGTAGTAACGDGDCTNEVSAVSQATQNALNAIQNSTGQAFRSFSSFKYNMGRAGDGQAWHHIVEQNKNNVTKFGNQLIQNTNNLIRLPDRAGEIHRQISGFYSSIQPDVTGSTTQTVRQWMSTQSFEEQFKFGMDVIKMFDGSQHIIDKFGG
jgi:hypothetical protein